jgi:RNA polymerase sigma-54 factor
VKPEVFTYQNKRGEWLVRVDGRDLPEIHISQRYQKMLADPSVSAEAKSYIRERIRAAEVLRESVKKRQQTIHDHCEDAHGYLLQEWNDAKPYGD